MDVIPRPVIVLVHGAWHVPQHYEEFISRLRKAGYEVECPHLPTCGNPPQKDASMYTDAEVVRGRVLSQINNSRDVVMLLHSYGGAVGTEAIKGLTKTERASEGLPGGVIRLVYMCAFMLQEGQSCAGASLPRPEPEPIEFDESSATTFLCEPPVILFYADLAPALAAEMEALLVRQAGNALGGTITHEAWRNVPTTYLRAENDGVLFPHWQDKMIQAVEGAGVALRIESYSSSHSPYLSMPDQMVEAVERAIA